MKPTVERLQKANKKLQHSYEVAERNYLKFRKQWEGEAASEKVGQIWTKGLEIGA